MSATTSPFHHALIHQDQVRASMITLTDPGFFSKLLSSNSYHVVEYCANTHLDKCSAIAFTFSNNPEIFLDTIRREIQFDNISLTMSVNHWVRCDNILDPSIELDFYVEYYVYTLKNGFPYAIFFRISNQIYNYAEKLEFFIKSLLDKQMENLCDTHIINTQNLIKRPHTKPHAQPHAKSHAKPHSRLKYKIFIGIIIILLFQYGYVKYSNYQIKLVENNTLILNIKNNKILFTTFVIIPICGCVGTLYFTNNFDKCEE